MLVNIFAEELASELRRRASEAAAAAGGDASADAGHVEPQPDDVFAAVSKVMRRCRGGYSVVMLINKLGLVAFRDPHGARRRSCWCCGARWPHATGGAAVVAPRELALRSRMRFRRCIWVATAIALSLARACSLFCSAGL